MSQRSLFAESTAVVIEALPNVRQPNESIAREAAQFLKPAHLDAAKDWPDWHECLMWAWECEATVAEMEAWRRAFKGKSDQNQPKIELRKSKKLWKPQK